MIIKSRATSREMKWKSNIFQESQLIVKGQNNSNEAQAVADLSGLRSIEVRLNFPDVFLGFYETATVIRARACAKPWKCPFKSRPVPSCPGKYSYYIEQYNNIIDFRLLNWSVIRNWGTVKTRIKRTGVLGIQAGFVLLHRMFSAKSAWKMFFRCS